MSTLTPKGLGELGLDNIGRVFYNIDYNELLAHEINHNECKLSTSGAAICDTGIFTGRSPGDKYFVDQEPSNQHIAWGNINQPIKEDIFDELLELTQEQLSGKDIYVIDAYCGASDNSRRKVRFISEVAWQAHFVKNMFIRPTEDELRDFVPDFI
ncbi:MAG TPA: phosphoenolpyruvate carboxykinase (ATP), partial [Sulfurovum sp.]|nr:phosphoenolpyruvate carboxykinase (ATP) [Sulfurovum sp.]